MTERQREHLSAVVQCDGNVSEAARGLRVARETIKSTIARCQKLAGLGERAKVSKSYFGQREAFVITPETTFSVGAAREYLPGNTVLVGGERFTVAKPAPLPEVRVGAPSSAGVEKLRKIVHGRKRGEDPIELEELCDRLEMHPSAARALVAEARAQGIDVELHDSGHVGRAAPSDPMREISVEMPAPVKSKHVFAAVGDIHFG